MKLKTVLITATLIAFAWVSNVQAQTILEKPALRKSAAAVQVQQQPSRWSRLKDNIFNKKPADASSMKANIKAKAMTGGGANVGAKNLNAIQYFKYKDQAIMATVGGAAQNFLLSPPKVVHVTPPNGVTAVVTDSITVTFSKKMKIDSVTDSISLSPGLTILGNAVLGNAVLGNAVLGDAVPITVVPNILDDVDEAGKMFTINHGALLPDADYVVKITTGAKDQNGTALEDVYSWVFHTVEHPCLVPEFDYKIEPTPEMQTLCQVSQQIDPGLDCSKFFCTGYYDDDGISWVESAGYRLSWTTKNVTYVEENCHDFAKDVNFDGDSGVIDFSWDGPTKNTPAPVGWSARLDRLLRDVLNPLPQAWAWGYVPPPVLGQGGTRNCNVIAHGACNKSVQIQYKYWCK